MEISLSNLKVVVVDEKHFVDAAKELPSIFDIARVEVEEEELDRRYCGCLLEKVLNFEKPFVKAFLDYQCKAKVRPIQWLFSLELLLNANGALLIQSGCAKKMSDLFWLIDEKRLALEQFQREQVAIQITNTIREKSPKDNTSISKTDSSQPVKIPWNGAVNILADMFFQATQMNGNNGKPLLPINTTSLIGFIETHFYRLDGKPLTRSSLQTYLSPSKPEKRPAKGKGIVVQEDLENKEEE